MAAINISTTTPIDRARLDSGNVVSCTVDIAVTAGDVVTSLSDTAGNGIAPVDLDDAAAYQGFGIALKDGAVGETVPVALQGTIVVGYAFSPSDTATHRPGNWVYTADDGGLDDNATPVSNTHPIGQIVSWGNGVALMVSPQPELNA